MERNNHNEASVSDQFNKIRESYYVTEKIHERYLSFLDISKESLHTFKKAHDSWIFGYTDLDFLIQEQVRPDNYNKVLVKLEEIRALLQFENQKNHDVIVWFVYLYYFEWLSVLSISKILQWIGIEWKYQTLSHFLKNTLRWNLRKHTYITEGGVNALSYVSTLRTRVNGVFTEEK